VARKIQEAAERELEQIKKSNESIEEDKKQLAATEGMIFERHFEGDEDDGDLDDIIAEQNR
jgi:hypothetical protein